MGYKGRGLDEKKPLSRSLRVYDPQEMRAKKNPAEAGLNIVKAGSGGATQMLPTNPAKRDNLIDGQAGIVALGQLLQDQGESLLQGGDALCIGILPIHFEHSTS